jgi:VIT1/CCC1 family predicted Fe2+/Mn2+ transporter
MSTGDAEDTRYGALAHIAIGASDGMTIPFAVVMGFAAADTSAYLILPLGALALATGTIGIAVGAFTATRTVRHEDLSPSNDAQKTLEEENVKNFLKGLDIENEIQQQAVDDLNKERESWREFTEQHQPLIASNKQRNAAAWTITLAYLFSGLIPLLPYIYVAENYALRTSFIATCIMLFLVGWIRGAVTSGSAWKQALRVLFSGAAAGVAAYAVGYLLSGMG